MNQLKQKYLAFFMLLLVVGLQGCTSINPIAQADTLELRAYAASGTYNIFAARGLALIRTGTLPDDVSLRLITLQERATPVVDSLDEALEEFEVVRDAISAGEAGSERLVIVSRNLNTWVTRAYPLVTSLKNAVKGAE